MCANCPWPLSGAQLSRIREARPRTLPTAAHTQLHPQADDRHLQPHRGLGRARDVRAPGPEPELERSGLSGVVERCCANKLCTFGATNPLAPALGATNPLAPALVPALVPTPTRSGAYSYSRPHADPRITLAPLCGGFR